MSRRQSLRNAALSNSPAAPKVNSKQAKATKAAKDAAEVLVAMNSPGSGLREPQPSSKPPEGEVEIVATAVGGRSGAERRDDDAWALKERREADNRINHENAKKRAERTQERQRSRGHISSQRQEALLRMRRLKYKEQIAKREANEKEKTKLREERALKAHQAAERRRVERRRSLLGRFSGIAREQSASHDLKVASLLRGDPLFSIENTSTQEVIVQFSLDYLPRLQVGRWFNQEIIDWYMCIVTSQYRSDCLYLGAEFHRQLLTRHKGPYYVADFHRPPSLRGVREGQGYCALEGRSSHPSRSCEPKWKPLDSPRRLSGAAKTMLLRFPLARTWRLPAMQEDSGRDDGMDSATGKTSLREY